MGGKEAIAVLFTVRGAGQESSNRMSTLWATLAALLGLLSGGCVLNSVILKKIELGPRVQQRALAGVERETNCSVLVRRGSSLWWAFVGKAVTLLSVQW